MGALEVRVTRVTLPVEALRPCPGHHDAGRITLEVKPKAK